MTARAAVVAGVGFVLFLLVAVFAVYAVAPATGQWIPWRETYGRIYIESPEVYTRERLVNDRYDQDYWLRTQLRDLDRSANLFSRKRSEALDMWYGKQVQSGVAAPTALDAPPFEKEFEIRSAMRDRIRQMILENLLDDRHDLTGNSVYGLKFDTSVIPGANTRADAIVRVTLNLPPFPSREDRLAFFRSSGDDIAADAKSRLQPLPAHYTSWVKNVEGRLNDYVRKTSKECGSSPAEQTSTPADEIGDIRRLHPSVFEALKNVLAIDERLVRSEPADFEHKNTLQQFRVDLPSPWNKFFFMNVLIVDDCPEQPLLTVEKIFNALWVVDTKKWKSLQEMKKYNDKILDYFNINNIRIDDSVKSQNDDASVTGNFAILVNNPYRSKYLNQEQFENLRLSASIGAKELSALLSRQNPELCMIQKPEGETGCALLGTLVFVESGLANFLDALADYDAYTYATFPRVDVSGVLAEAAIRATSSQDVGGVGELGISASSGSQSAETVPTLLGFAEGRRPETCESDDGPEGCPKPEEVSNAITFGWIIANDNRAQPIQKSQLVLVSVPAYLDRLDISVETAWLENDGTTEHGLDSYEMPTVRVPPDFEAFDTLVHQNERRHGPAIFKSFMGEEMLRACGPAEIVIPGARLWRSATVTIGDQAADKITVLPNMQGLLATFNEVHVPSSLGTNGGSLALKVWTSEGVDTENSKVRIVVPPGGVCPPRRAADAGDGATE